MQSDQQKQRSIYMRFHVTLEKAMNFAKKIYGKAVVAKTNISIFEHAIKISGLTQQLSSQDYLNYHLTWLTGILKDTLSFNQELYQIQIDNILCDLYKVEADRIKNKQKPQGQQYRQMFNRISQMDIIPCYIKIFQLYWYCSLWKEHRWESSIQQYEGYMAYAYMIWHRALLKHTPIGRDTQKYIKQFFKKIHDEYGGMSALRAKAQILYNKL